MSDQTNVINTFYVSREGGDVGAVACDADGKFVSAQICSSPFWHDQISATAYTSTDGFTTNVTRKDTT